MLFGWFRCGLVQGFHAVNPPRSAWAVGQEGNAADRQRPCDQRGMTACGTIVSSQRRKGLKFQRKRKTGKTKKTKRKQEEEEEEEDTTSPLVSFISAWI